MAAALAVKQAGFVGLTLIEPVRQRLPGILSQIYHPTGGVLLPLIDLHRAAVQVHIRRLRTQRLSDAHAGAQQQQEDRTIPNVIDDLQQLQYIFCRDPTRQPLGQLQMDLTQQQLRHHAILPAQIPHKHIHVLQSLPHRGDLQAPVPLVFHKRPDVLSTEYLLLADLPRAWVLTVYRALSILVV